MISTDSEAAAGILENDEQLVDGLLRKFNIECEGEIDDENETYSYSDEEEVDIYDKSEWDKYDAIERELHPARSRGYKDTLKYTINVNKSKNLYKLVTVIPAAEYKSRSKNFKSFDVAPKDKQKKKSCPIVENPIDKLICSECEENVDANALAVFKKIIHDQLLKSVNYLLEAESRWNIFHANCDSSYSITLDAFTIPSHPPEECMIKIFKESCESYPNNLKTPNETREALAKREWTNLKRAWNVIPCPQPIYYKYHLVVSSFIGANHKLAPKIRYVTFKRGDYIMIYHEIVESMRALYADANVIHGNLSEYSILWHKRKCYFVDFEKALQPHEPAAFDTLFMDCYRISKFFRDVDIPNMFTTNGLFTYITGYSYKHKPSLAKLVESKKLH